VKPEALADPAVVEDLAEAVEEAVVTSPARRERDISLLKKPNTMAMWKTRPKKRFPSSEEEEAEGD
jgi:hypothetical protein